MWKLTKDKFKIMMLFSLGYFCYYLCRYNYPIALPFIQEEFHLTATMVGLIATALTGGYAIGQFVNGFIIDRKGAVLMFTIGGIGSMVANLVMGGSFLFEMFVLAWMINGYFQSMGYPSSLRLIAHWFGPDEQAKPLGVSESLQSVASIVIPIFAGYIAFAVSWRLVFIIPAIIIGLMTIVFKLSAKDYPDGKEPKTKPLPLGRDIIDTYKQALGDWRLVLADISYGCCQFVRYAMITWIPLYLYTTTNMGIFNAAIISMTFQLGGVFGSLAIGWIADTKKFYKRRWSLITVGMAVSGIAGAVIGIIDPSAGWSIVAVLMICGAGIEALEVCYFLIPAEYLGKEKTATGVGCMNGVGKAMATVQGVVLGFIIDNWSFGSAFAVAGVFGILAAILVIPSGFKITKKKTGMVTG